MSSERQSSRRVLAALAAATALLASACSSEPARQDAEQAEDVSSATLASMLADADGLSVVSGALGDAGLSKVFDGAAAYTILAPQDAAFDALGDTGEALRSAEQRAAMVAILRDHIVPGYLTPEDIGRAIDTAGDGRVEMTTVGGHELTFTRNGEAITATAEDGASARFGGEALRARNGVAIPLDGILKATQPAEARPAAQ